jgi:predicted PurR-regulated permease PerM
MADRGLTERIMPEPTRWTSRQVVLVTLFVLLVGSGFWLIYRFYEVLFLLFLAIMLGTAIRPAVAWLERRGLPRAYGEAVIFLLIFLLVTGFIFLILPPLLEQSAPLSQLLTEAYRQVRRFMLESSSSLIQRLGLRMPFQLQLEGLLTASPGGTPAPTPDPAAATVDSTVDTVARLFQILGNVGRGLFATVAVFLMAFYWTLESERAQRSLLLFVPTERREPIREVVLAIQAKVGGFLLGQAALCAIIFVMQLVAYLLIGLPNALVLALIAGVMEAVPTIGPALGAVPAIIMAAAFDPSKIPLVILSALIVQLLENNLLVPRVMDRSVGVNPVLTFLALAALSSLFGVMGALVAIPIAAILNLLFERALFKRSADATIQPEGRDYVSYLRYQAQEIAHDVRKQVRVKEDEVDAAADELEDGIEAAANELDEMLAQVQEVQP